VLALAQGGALETVAEGLNGCFYDRCDGADLGAAYGRLSRRGAEPFDRAAMLTHARRFRRDRFGQQLARIIGGVMAP